MRNVTNHPNTENSNQIHGFQADTLFVGYLRMDDIFSNPQLIRFNRQAFEASVYSVFKPERE